MARRFSFLLLLLTTLLLTTTLTVAAPITYTFDGDQSSFSGTDGWQASYCSDPWTAALNGGIIAKTDDGCFINNCNADNNCGHTFSVWPGCGGSDPLDNHIQFGSNLWEDYIFTARFQNTDDDAVGFVFRYHNTANFYLLFFSKSSVPNVNDGCSDTFAGSRVYRIAGGKATKLAESTVTYTQGTEHSVRIEVDGDDFAIDFDANGNGAFSPAEALFSFADDDGPSAGKVGFWTFQNGAGAVDKCADGTCWFDDLSVDVFALENDGCDGISFEGICDGKTLKYCQNGQLLDQNCPVCCMWSSQYSYYACAGVQACQSCSNECSAGQMGCSSELTHSWVCAQSDDDDCLDRVYAACDETGVCDSETGECLATVCEPACGGKECGGDGCGGSCGTCGAGQKCVGGACVCVASCDGKVCGGDGCGGSCGTCGEGLTCTQDGACECVTKCSNKECGDDGCGGSCGSCLVGESCIAGLCICVPACENVQCGPDGCGGTCGVCGANEACANGLCECLPACAGKVCGDDGCDGLCGECPENFFCEEGACKEGECVPDCAGSECGADGCGGICGQCEDGEECLDHLCKPIVCEPSCIDKTCGPDGCGGVCGDCNDGELCDDGNCICIPICDGADCGSDGCGGSCGDCLEGWYCNGGICTEGECLPDCTDKECGDDGCGTPCGECEEGLVCDGGACSCAPQCEEKNCGNDGCGGNCGECEAGWYCKYGICSESECLPSCAGIECGDDGCGGVCGTCGEGFECSTGGQCTEIVDCEPKVELLCIDDQLFWVDSCGNQGDKVQDCKHGCGDGECIGEPTPDVTIPTEQDGLDEPDEKSAANGEAVTFGTGAKSGGCSTSSSNPATAGLLLLLLMGLAFLRRQQTT